jgi:hypothetical protein
VDEQAVGELAALPAVLYALHAVCALSACGAVTWRSLRLLLFHRHDYHRCPHRRIVGLFRFSCAADVALLLWYVAASSSAIRIVAVDALRDSVGGLVDRRGRADKRS